MISFDDITYQWETIDGQRMRMVVIVRIPMIDTAQKEMVKDTVTRGIKECFKEL